MVKVMPEYYKQISDIIVFGDGGTDTLTGLMTNLLSNGTVNVMNNQYICSYNGLELGIHVSQNAENLLYSTATGLGSTLNDNDDDDNNDGINSYQILESKKVPKETISLMSDCRSMYMKYIKLDSPQQSAGFTLERNFAMLMLKSKSTFSIEGNEERVNKKDMERFENIIQQICCFAICLQSSAFFSKQRTKNIRYKNKNNESKEIHSVVVLSGPPAFDNDNAVEEEKEESKIYSLIFYLYNAKLQRELPTNSSLYGIMITQIEKILASNPALSNQIQTNVRVSKENIPDTKWYSKWNTFLPPLFPLSIACKDIITVNPELMNCSSSTPYSYKFSVQKKISDLSFCIMNDSSGKRDDGPNKESITSNRERIKTLSNIVTKCYNYPSTPRYIVSVLKSGNNYVEQIREFTFSEKFKKEFIEFYAPENFQPESKGETNENTQASFYSMLQKINTENIISDNFSKRSVKEVEEKDDIVDNKEETKEKCETNNSINNNTRTALSDILSNLDKDNGSELTSYNDYLIKLKVSKAKTSICLGSTAENSANSPLLTKINNIFKEEKDVFQGFEGITRSGILNFWQVNISGIVNVFFNRFIKENKGDKEAKEEWYKCWRDNLNYYGYSNDIVAKLFRNKESVNGWLYKVRYTLYFLICLGLNSTKDRNQENIAGDYFEYALDNVIANRDCLMFSAPQYLEAGLKQDKEAERKNQATLDKLRDNDLRKLLRATVGVAEWKQQQEEDMRA